MSPAGTDPGGTQPFAAARIIEWTAGALLLLLLAVATATHPAATVLSPFSSFLGDEDRITVLREGAWHGYNLEGTGRQTVQDALGAVRPWHRIDEPPSETTYLIHFQRPQDREPGWALRATLHYRPQARAIGHQGTWYRLGALEARGLETVAAQFDARGYGELVAWPAVDQMFVPGSTATLVDLKTGQSFEIRRREVMTGLYHADVEPLTAADTAKFRRIVGGQWTWDRRAVVLHLGKRRIAASVNAMPHGGQDLADNAFPGHFCLHTLGSWTHVGQRMDADHLMRVLEAAGLEVEGADLNAPAARLSETGC